MASDMSEEASFYRLQLDRLLLCTPCNFSETVRAVKLAMAQTPPTDRSQAISRLIEAACRVTKVAVGPTSVDPSEDRDIEVWALAKLHEAVDDLRTACGGEV